MQRSQNLRSAFSSSRAVPAYVLWFETIFFGNGVWNEPCSPGGMSEARRCVYVLRSCADRTRYYTGITNDWRARLEAHNDGRCHHTANGRPWEIDVIVEFADQKRAVAFEQYLKSGSGCAFAKRHLR